MTPRMIVIVEGWSDHDRVKGAVPEMETIVTNGTRMNNRIREQIRSHILSGDYVCILSDPDTAGDQLASMVQGEFLLPRISVDPEKAKCYNGKKEKYGIEYCSNQYLRELLGGYMKWVNKFTS